MELIVPGVKFFSSQGMGDMCRLPDNSIIKVYPHFDFNHYQMNIHLKIFDSFNKLKNIKGDKFIDLINEFVTVSRPIDYYAKPIRINEKKYRSYLRMGSVNGIPISVYEKFDKNEVTNSFDEGYLKNIDNFDVMAFFQLNYDSGQRFLRINMEKKMNYGNDVMGYNVSIPFLDFLRKEYGFKLSLEEINQIIGFIYGWIYFDAGYVADEIVISLGYLEKHKLFKINVLNFEGVDSRFGIDTKELISIAEPRYNQEKEFIFGLQRAEQLAKEMKAKVNISTGPKSSYYKYKKYKTKYCNLHQKI